LWSNIRKDLDSGYELVGAFQDLDHSGIDYTELDVIPLRTPCLEWKKTFLVNQQKQKYLDYLRNPSYLKLYPRDTVPTYFWNVAGAAPSLKYSGPENIALLFRNLLLADRKIYNTSILLLTNVTDTVNQTIFHSFRKLQRAILSIDEEFRNIIKILNQNEYDEVIYTIKQVYTKLGNLHDMLVKYEYYVRREEVKKAERQREDVDTEWVNTLDWMKERDLWTLFGKIVV